MRAATEVDEAAGEVGQRWPQFLPDGRQFLFYMRRRDGVGNGAYVGSLDATGHRLVLHRPRGRSTRTVVCCSSATEL